MSSKDNLPELVFLFHHVALGDLTLAFRAGSRGLGPLKHLAGHMKLVVLSLRMVAAAAAAPQSDAGNF